MEHGYDIQMGHKWKEWQSMGVAVVSRELGSDRGSYPRVFLDTEVTLVRAIKKKNLSQSEEVDLEESSEIRRLEYSTRFQVKRLD